MLQGTIEWFDGEKGKRAENASLSKERIAQTAIGGLGSFPAASF
jgi:hypothetical protein